MSERFKPEAPPTLSPEQAEEAKFWEQEITAWLASEKRDQAPKDVRERIYNNISGWLPSRMETGMVGSYRRDPAARTHAAELTADVDAYLAEHNETERGLEISDLITKNNARLTELTASAMKSMDMQALKNYKPERGDEIEDFLERLYMAMRKKGYTRDELAK